MVAAFDKELVHLRSARESHITQMGEALERHRDLVPLITNFERAWRGRAEFAWPSAASPRVRPSTRPSAELHNSSRHLELMFYHCAVCVGPGAASRQRSFRPRHSEACNDRSPLSAARSDRTGIRRRP
jgi:hypothetical protein